LIGSREHNQSLAVRKLEEIVDGIQIALGQLWQSRPENIAEPTAG
jgi:hypothetical protein